MGSLNIDSSKISDHAKYLEVILKHYTDLFIYHAAQRLSTFRYFLAAFSILVASFASLITRYDSNQVPLQSERFVLAAGVLSVAVFLLTITFARLDKRNEQIIHINELPIKAVQTWISVNLPVAGASHDQWNCLLRTDNLAKPVTTFSTLIPVVYFICGALSIGGITLAISKHDRLLNHINNLVGVESLLIVPIILFIFYMIGAFFHLPKKPS